MSRLENLLLYCRPGFEGECAAEIQEVAAARGIAGYARTQSQSGVVTFHCSEAGIGLEPARLIRFADLIFARQLCALLTELTDLPARDRVTPLCAALAGRQVSALLVETADTNEAKQLQAFCRKFQTPMREGLQRAGLLREGDAALPRLHLLFVDSAHVLVALSYADNASPWPMGIARLKFPREAPSRSTLKLDEALLFFLSEPERERYLAPGMTAVDLGAAPGGWTYQLVRRHIQVTAVDNGALAPSLLDSGLVRHLRVDAFTFRPPKPVTWMVCDMVEQPRRVALLVADWVARGDCAHSVFNLKLPMKKRYQEVALCAGLIRERLAQAGVDHVLRFKQLYHDREEVTGYLRRASEGGGVA